MSNIKISLDAADLAWAVAEHIVQRAKAMIRDHGLFSLALSGGSTPLPLFALLALPEWQARVEWSRVHIFWADERCVPPDHADSNYNTAYAALIGRVPLPAGNIHRIQGELDPAQAAEAYENELHIHLGAQGNLDLVLLGMGDDGHTASLFPGTAAVHEQSRLVIAHFVEKVKTWRVTLTPKAINAAAQVVFMVSGKGKAERLRETLRGDYQPDVLPAQAIQPTSSDLIWMVDKAAAVLLS